MNDTYFVTGIGTNVGKTIVSAILTQALQADYWKPIQAGDLDYSDTHKVKALVSNDNTVFHPNSFSLNHPMSPHAAAHLEGVEITVAAIQRPVTKNSLVIEGAGGLLVPINNRETVLDLILPTDKLVLVSRNYLGSINHTLLSLEVIKQRGLTCFGIVFGGDENKATEEVILEISGASMLGRIEEEPYFDSNVVEEYAQAFRSKLV